MSAMSPDPKQTWKASKEQTSRRISTVVVRAHLQHFASDKKLLADDAFFLAFHSLARDLETRLLPSGVLDFRQNRRRFTLAAEGIVRTYEVPFDSRFRMMRRIIHDGARWYYALRDLVDKASRGQTLGDGQ